MNSKHIFLSTLIGPLVIPSLNAAETNRPNILFVISDDQSYPHASAYGSPIAKTPAFDFVARNGWLFNNAFVTSPGSSPSRASILTGLYPWQIAEAGTHVVQTSGMACECARVCLGGCTHVYMQASVFMYPWAYACIFMVDLCVHV